MGHLDWSLWDLEIIKKINLNIWLIVIVIVTSAKSTKFTTLMLDAFL